MLKSFPARNVVFFLIIVLVLIYTLFAFNLGASQDAGFVADYQSYNNADNLIQQGDFTDAAPLIAQLMHKYPDSYLVMWEYANYYLRQGNYRKSRDYFDQIKKQRPFIVNDETFDYYYGLMSYQLKDYSLASKYLIRAWKINTDKQLSQNAQNLLQSISQHTS